MTVRVAKQYLCSPPIEPLVGGGVQFMGPGSRCTNNGRQHHRGVLETAAVDFNEEKTLTGIAAIPALAIVSVTPRAHHSPLV